MPRVEKVDIGYEGAVVFGVKIPWEDTVGRYPVSKGCACRLEVECEVTMVLVVCNVGYRGTRP